MSAKLGTPNILAASKSHPSTVAKGLQNWKRYLPGLPILEWGREYNRETLMHDLVAAMIVTIMLIPQSLAYALLAGLPPEVGLYASIAPLLLYAVFGTSRVLAVGPVAVASLMTAAAIGHYAVQGPAVYWTAAITLAFMSGLILLVMGFLRLGLLANFLSHPVISGFISASGIIIAASQLKTLMGVKADGSSLFVLIGNLAQQVSHTHLITLGIGVAATTFLFWVRKGLKPLLVKFGMKPKLADMVAKAGPVVAIAATTILVWAMDWQNAGVKIVGNVPQGLPSIVMPSWDVGMWRELFMPALLISIIGFVESVSVGQTLAAKRRQRIKPDQELVALGFGNMGSALSGGFPVTGGFARSVVNFDAGAQTPAAGVYTAVGIAVATMFLTPALYYLPQATLSATIIVAVLSLVDLSILKRTWLYSKFDFAAVATTLFLTLLLGVEIGLMVGVAVSILLYLYRSSRPHIAVVGLVEGTEHFRNIERYSVRVSPNLLSMRIDESLYFGNVRMLEDSIGNAVATMPELKHLVLQCSAINSIDVSALEALESIEQRLKASGVALHLSEVKGPVMDRLCTTEFVKHLSGQVFLTHFQAVKSLVPEMFN